MEQQKLRELLETLHLELERIGSVDEKTAEVLTVLKNDIKNLEHEGAPGEDEKEGLSERMREAVGHFEEEHPQLSIMIQHVLDSLSRMGF